MYEFTKKKTMMSFEEKWKNWDAKYLRETEVFLLSFTCKINERESTMCRIKSTFHSVTECKMYTTVIGVKLFNYCICKLVHMLCFFWF